MSSGERTDVIASITGTDKNNGYAAAAYKSSMSGMDTLQKQYG